MRVLRRVLLLITVLGTLSAGVSADDGGKAIYEARCAFCHGMEGRGDGPAGAALKPPPTNFASPDFARNTPTERIKETIAQGRQGTAMVPFGKTLKPEEIDAVTRYVLGLAPK